MNTAFGYFVYSILIFIDFSYQIAIALSTILGIIFNYHSISRLVFRYKSKNRILRFIFSYLLIYIININGVSFFYSNGINLYLSFLMIFLPTSLINYLVMRYFVFGGEN